MRLSLIAWLENNMVPCQYNLFFGISCPMCGFQRSLVELLKGNFIESFLLFPALIPFLLTLGAGFLFFFNRTKLQRTLVVMLIADLAIMSVSCILKNIGILP